MTRYVIDAPTLLHLADGDLTVDTRMTEVKIRVLGDRVSRWTAWKIARDQDWDALRDAEYLAVAKLEADALVTVDPDLAAKADGVVPVEPVGNLFE